MPNDSLLPLLDALLRLRQLEPGELQSLLRQLPTASSDPQAVAGELLQRGWITPEQFASLCPPAESPVHPPARETVLIGFGDDDAPLDPEAADADQWSLPTDEDTAPPSPQPEPPSLLEAHAQPEAISQPPSPEPPPIPEPAPAAPSVTVDAPAAPAQFEWEALAPAVAENQPAPREHQTDRQMRQVLTWSGKALTIWLLFLASFFYGAWLLRPMAKPHSVAMPTRTAKSTSPEGERWWEGKSGQLIDVDAILAAQQAKEKGAKGRQTPSSTAAAGKSIPDTKINRSPPPDPEKPPPAVRVNLPPGAVLLGADDQPQVTALAFQNNSVVATGNEQGRLMIWEAEKGRLLHSWQGHRDRVNRIAFSAEGRCMVTSGNDRMVRVWNGTSGNEIRSWASDALSLAISTDGRHVAAGCVDGLVRLTDLGGGESWSHPKAPAKTNPRSVSEPLSLAFSPDSTMLAVGYSTGQVQVLDLVTRKQSKTFVAHKMVYAVAFSPDGRSLTTGGKDGTIKWWDIAAGKEMRSISNPGNHPVAALAYSQRSPYLAAASWDGTVHLWHLGEVGSMKVAKSIRLPQAGFGAQIDLSPDGRLLGCVHGGNPACVIPIAP